MRYGRKFAGLLLGCFVILVTAILGKMDANVMLSLSAVIGGFYGSNGYIEGAALKAGK